MYSFLSLILVVLAWIAIYFYISNKQKHLQSFSNSLSAIQNHFLKSNCNLQNFILSGFHDPQLYDTNKQADIDAFLSSQHKSITTLKSIINDAELYHLNLFKDLDKLIVLHQSLTKSATTLKTLYKSKGYKNYGFEGLMRHDAHELEAKKLVPAYDLLMLRRHEKDFLIRGETKYVEQFNVLINKTLAEYPSGSASKKVLYSYQTNFNQLVKYTSQLGVSNNEGIYKVVQTSINNLDIQYVSTREAAEAGTRILRKDFNIILIAATLLLILVIIWLSLLLSKVLTRDILELNKRVFAFINSKFDDISADQDNNVFAPSTKEIDELNAHFLLLKKNLRITFEDLQKSNTDLQSHSDNQNQLYQELQVQSEELQAQSNELQIHTKNLKILNEQLEEERKNSDLANKAKSTFLATMSHEIRTPMNGVMGMATLLSETQLSYEQDEYVKTIRTSGDALLNVINDILDFSKVESGNLELEIHDFNLRECVENTLDVFSSKAAEQGIDLIYKLDKALPEMIVGDKFRLRQILVNFISNALKFTHAGEVYLEIKMLTNSANELKILFNVHDTGIGIPQNKLSRLFKAFSQIDSSISRKYGGSGLGLVISERLIKLMGGNVGVDSVVGKGTTFWFTIATKTTIGKPFNNYSIVPKIASLEHKKVLIVDDNFTSRSVLGNQLSFWKMQVTLASSGNEALQCVATNYFDLLIVDMVMPEMSGLDFTKAVKFSFPNLPIILLGLLGDEHMAKNPGLFTATLAKPIKQAQLQNAVRMPFESSHQQFPDRNNLKVSTMTKDFAATYPLDILIAEDNLINQKLAMRVLNKLGYQPKLANNGIEAVKMLLDYPFQIILMDMQMPEMDGLEATRVIRSGKNTQPDIVAMTANVLPEDKEACFKAGMNGFISKPFKLESLMETLIRASLNLNNNLRR